jgi:hypothetical protein
VSRPAYIEGAHLFPPCPSDSRDWHAAAIEISTGKVSGCGACGYVPTAERIAIARAAVGLPNGDAPSCAVTGEPADECDHVEHDEARETIARAAELQARAQRTDLAPAELLDRWPNPPVVSVRVDEGDW